MTLLNIDLFAVVILSMTKAHRCGNVVSLAVNVYNVARFCGLHRK